MGIFFISTRVALLIPMISICQFPMCGSVRVVGSELVSVVVGCGRGG